MNDPGPFGDGHDSPDGGTPCAVEIDPVLEAIDLGDAIAIAVRRHRRFLRQNQRTYAAQHGLSVSALSRVENSQAEQVRMSDVQAALAGSGFMLDLVGLGGWDDPQHPCECDACTRRREIARADEWCGDQRYDDLGPPGVPGDDTWSGGDDGVVIRPPQWWGPSNAVSAA